MNRDRKHLLGVVLADDIVVEDLTDLLRGRNIVARFPQQGLVLLADNVHAKLDAFVADEHGRPGNELAHLVLALAAERAIKRVLRIATADLAHSLLRESLLRIAKSTPTPALYLRIPAAAANPTRKRHHLFANEARYRHYNQDFAN